jgi:hypothetical protein
MSLPNRANLIGMTIKYGGLDYEILNMDRDLDVIIMRATDGLVVEFDYIDQVLEQSEWYDV